jgi:hypothetical protein
MANSGCQFPLQGDTQITNSASHLLLRPTRRLAASTIAVTLRESIPSSCSTPADSL